MMPGVPAGYTDPVGSVFSALLACLFVVMVAADQFVCPDGCTDEAPAQVTCQHAPSSCAICHGWSQAPFVMGSRPALLPIAKPLVIVINPTEPVLPTVERPPKTT
jgi:hypothetical protein